MAEIVPVGKRWRVKLQDGSFLLNNDTGEIRFFNRQSVAQFHADNLTRQEQNRSLSPSERHKQKFRQKHRLSW
jgi:hypothetical protein